LQWFAIFIEDVEILAVAVVVQHHFRIADISHNYAAL
jgi:hypothetical protein